MCGLTWSALFCRVSTAGRFNRTGGRRKAAVPRRDDRPVYGLKTSKNFVVSNAVENILAGACGRGTATHAAVPVFSPRLPVVFPPAAPKMVDNGRLDYTKKEDYGKVPAYLGEVKAQIDEERTMIQEMLMQQDVEGDYDTVTELSDSERKELIAALQAKWDAVNAQYQLITFKRVSSSNSTVGAIRRCVVGRCRERVGHPAACSVDSRWVPPACGWQEGRV